MELTSLCTLKVKEYELKTTNKNYFSFINETTTTNIQ